MNSQFMRGLLVEESFAYGFTIAFWGSGLLLLERLGPLDVGAILAFTGGTVTGFGLLAVATFGSPIDTVSIEEPPGYFVLAGIHYISGLVPILATYLIIQTGFGRLLKLVLAGVAVAVLYNVFAALEQVVSEVVWRVERRLDGRKNSPER